MRELRNRPIAGRRGRTRAACKHKKKADLKHPNARTHNLKSFAKKSQSHACVSELPISEKVRPIPRSGGVYFRFILADLERDLGNFSFNCLETVPQLRFEPISIAIDRAATVPLMSTRVVRESSASCTRPLAIL
jgi:hypothetical protein